MYHFIISLLALYIATPLENPLSHPSPSLRTHLRLCAAYLLSRLSSVVTSFVKHPETWQTELIPLSLAAHKLC